MAEDYITSYTKESQEIIAYLEQRIRDLEEGGGFTRDEYLYQIDARYEEIRQRLISISEQTNQSITVES
jgi:hypothetical protein